MKARTTSALDEVLIHVHYPHAHDAIVLRTERDWDEDVPPVAVKPEANRCEFVIKSSDPFVYFKPVLHRDGEAHWAIGPNWLAVNGSERVYDVFPAFEPAQAAFTAMEHLDTELGRWSYRVFTPANYAENTLHRYPVLYMNDGHNLFFHQESATGADWGVQHTLSQLAEMTHIEPVIVVGVYPGNREADYTGAADSSYARFLARARDHGRDGLVAGWRRRFELCVDAP
jgi:hypothetical protein